MDKVIKIGCAIIVLKNGEILFGKRKNCYGAGSWGLPGGHLEYGEKLIDAAKRELKEETGITDVALTLTSIIDDSRVDQHYIHISFKTNNYEGPIELKEPERCGEWRFFSHTNLPKNIFIGHQKIIAAFQKGLIYKNTNL